MIIIYKYNISRTLIISFNISMWYTYMFSWVTLKSSYAGFQRRGREHSAGKWLFRVTYMNVTLQIVEHDLVQISFTYKSDYPTFTHQSVKIKAQIASTTIPRHM